MSKLIRSNPHTHTQFCDGRSTAEEMVRSAIRLGFHTLGFSPHSYYPPDTSWCMEAADVPRYIAEIERLRNIYGSEIRIRLGLELDLYSLGHMDLSPYEYLVGSVHDYLSPVTGKLWSYDNSAARTSAMLLEEYEGDTLRMAKQYYGDVLKMVTETRPTIIGHFDLLTKFDDQLHLFSTEDRAYRDLATETLLACCETGAVTEVNLSTMIRGYRKTPYPDEVLLKELLSHHYPVILSTDCHDASTLDWGLDETALYLRELGFRSVLELGPDSLLEEVPLNP